MNLGGGVGGLSSGIEPRILPQAPAKGHWSAYAYAVVQRMVSNFGAEADGGVHISIASDLPAASGMSTSSALICGVFLALRAVLRIPRA